MDDKLKHCPFCGDDASVYRMHNGNYFCGCNTAGNTCIYVIRATKEQAVTAWNIRVAN